MSRRAYAVVVALLLAAVGFAPTLTAGAASAHAARVSADPADKASVSAGPVRVNLVEFGTSAADPVYPD